MALSQGTFSPAKVRKGACKTGLLNSAAWPRRRRLRRGDPTLGRLNLASFPHRISRRRPQPLTTANGALSDAPMRLSALAGVVRWADPAPLSVYRLGSGPTGSPRQPPEDSHISRGSSPTLAIKKIEVRHPPVEIFLPIPTVVHPESDPSVELVETCGPVRSVATQLAAPRSVDVLLSGCAGHANERV
jgi:hypothetical protein